MTAFDMFWQSSDRCVTHTLEQYVQLCLFNRFSRCRCDRAEIKRHQYKSRSLIRTPAVREKGPDCFLIPCFASILYSILGSDIKLHFGTFTVIYCHGRRIFQMFPHEADTRIQPDPERWTIKIAQSMKWRHPKRG